MDRDRKRKINRGIDHFNNALVATFWTAVGVVLLIVAAKGIGDFWTLPLGIGATLYGLYGFYRVLL